MDKQGYREKQSQTLPCHYLNKTTTYRRLSLKSHRSNLNNSQTLQGGFVKTSEKITSIIHTMDFNLTIFLK